MHKKIGMALSLAIMAALLLTAIAVAAGPDRLNGRWQDVDKFDGSTINMTLAGPPSGPFRVIWTESSFTLCDDTRHGIGRGTAELTAPNTLHLELDFECFHSAATAEFETDLIYDPAAHTLDPVDESSGATLFTRP